MDQLDHWDSVRITQLMVTAIECLDGHQLYPLRTLYKYQSIILQAIYTLSTLKIDVG